jgi:hypothetical protein
MIEFVQVKCGYDATPLHDFRSIRMSCNLGPYMSSKSEGMYF